MFRTAVRSLPRRPPSLAAPRVRTRWLNTAPPHESARSWRNSAVRWGIAIVGLYYYNTSTAFAEQPPVTLPAASEADQSTLPTLESLSPSKRKESAEGGSGKSPNTEAAGEIPALAGGGEATAESLEEEAHSEGAFNEETGEINWDCPCLGGMAHGPCGPEFREAFSCFVFSKEEPKGMDCIDRFKNMQNCFREHPDVYGAELEEDEEDEAFGEDAPQAAAAPSPEEGSTVAAAVDRAKEMKDELVASPGLDEGLSAEKPRNSPSPSRGMNDGSQKSPDQTDQSTAVSKTNSEPQKAEHTPAQGDNEDEPVPRAAHDATDVSPPKDSEKK